jgi:peptide/nickel transport system permease protein
MVASDAVTGRAGVMGGSVALDLWRGVRRRLGEYHLTFRLLLRRPLAVAGLVITLGYVAVAIAAAFLPDRDVLQTDFSNPFPRAPWWWAGGQPGLWLGTTYPGIDLGMAIFKAIRIDLYYSAIVVLGGAVLGILVGLVAGYKGGLFDEGLMRTTDVTYSIPFLVFAIAVAYVISRDFTTLNLALLILWWPPYARLVRSQVLVVKSHMFVEAARAAGASDLRIMFRHILPNTLAPVFVQISLDLGVVIQIFAALIFIGYAPHGGYLPELGALIYYGFERGPRDYPWTILFPGLALVVFTVGINLLGDGLRDVLDPRLRR